MESAPHCLVQCRLVESLGFKKVFQTNKYTNLYNTQDTAMMFTRQPSYKTANYFNFSIGSNSVEKIFDIIKTIELQTDWKFGMIN